MTMLDLIRTAAWAVLWTAGVTSMSWLMLGHHREDGE